MFFFIRKRSDPSLLKSEEELGNRSLFVHMYDGFRFTVLWKSIDSHTSFCTCILLHIIIYSGLSPISFPSLPLCPKVHKISRSAQLSATFDKSFLVTWSLLDCHIHFPFSFLLLRVLRRLCLEYCGTFTQVFRYF